MSRILKTFKLKPSTCDALRQLSRDQNRSMAGVIEHLVSEASTTTNTTITTTTTNKLSKVLDFCDSLPDSVKFKVKRFSEFAKIVLFIIMQDTDYDIEQVVDLFSLYKPKEILHAHSQPGDLLAKTRADFVYSGALEGLDVIVADYGLDPVKLKRL